MTIIIEELPNLQILTERQLSIEEDTAQEAAKTYKDKLLMARMKGKDMTVFAPERYLLAHTVEKTAKAIHAWLLPKKGHRVGEGHAFKAVLSTVDIYELAYITARHMVNALYLDAPWQRIALGLAREVRTHINYIRLRKAEPALVRAIEEAVKTTNIAHKQKVWVNNLNTRAAEGKYEYIDWEESDLFVIGNILGRLWMQATGMADTRLERKGAKTITKVLPAPEVMDYLGKSHDQAKFMNPTFPPMVVPPMPWTSFYGGGYLTNFGTRRMAMVSCKTKEVRKKMEVYHPEMPKVTEALNIIQNTPWRINAKVLEVLKEVRDRGGNMAGIPAMEQELVKPIKPWATKEEGEFMKQQHPEVFREYTHKAKVFWDSWARSNSKRMAVHKKVRFGEQFVNEKAIFMPAYCDWRGRVYFTPVVNPQSDDSGRALLEFAEPKAITEAGIPWLYIHLANTFGEDKSSFAERISFTEMNMATILRVAQDPMSERWWMDADDPFKCLAACLEVAGVQQYGAKHMTRLPIAMDGACNAYQHYLGMLKDDNASARAVNLVPGDRPGDIYSEVAKVVVPIIEAEATKGNEMARLWVGKIDRGICKRGTMTNVYGVTSWGIVEQLIQEITKRDSQTPGVRYLGDELQKTPKACAFLGPKLEEGINTVVSSAARAMDFLQEVAGVVSDAGHHLEWVTPIGFKAVQIYRKAEFKRVKSVLGGVTYVSTLAEDIPGTISKRHMRNAAAPCFVHSMDSSMLMETAIRSHHEHGLSSFAFIHDSYGTHACDSAVLARTLREVFVDMYAERNPLAEFKAQIEEQHPDLKLPELPEVGTLDVRQVLDSPYFFA